MGILDRLMGRESNRSSERSNRSSTRRSSRSVVKSSKPKSGFIKHTAKQVWGVAEKTGKDIHENYKYAAEYRPKKFAIENRGFEKAGSYSPDSTMLQRHIKMWQNKGYKVATAKSKNGWGEDIVVLFKKYTGKTTEAAAKVTTVRAVTVKKAKAPKAKKPKKVPATVVISGKTYRKEATYSGYKDSAVEYARARARDGYSARVKKFVINGDAVYTVYTAKKKQPQYEFVA